MRSRYNKKCDTKKGRVGDTDEDAIIAAPDSTIKVNESLFFKTPSNEAFNETSTSREKAIARKSLNFVESTPKSIMIKRGKGSEKKRKLSFRENFSEHYKKFPR